MPAGATSDTDAGGLTVFDETLDTIVTTVKWIIGSAAAVLAALLAGLQLSDLGRVDGRALAVSLTAYAAALVAIGIVLIRAAGVLVKPGLTISDLADRELRARRKAVEAAHGDPSQMKPSAAYDPLLAALSRRRRELLPGTVPAPLDLQDFYTQQMALVTAWETIRGGGRAKVANTTYVSSNDADVAALRERVGSAAAVADRLLDAAHLYVAQREYRRLRKTLIWSGLAILIALPAFAIASHKEGNLASADVTSPVKVTVYLTGTPAQLKDAGIAATCNARTLAGIAIGGTYSEPLVAVSDPPTCGPARVKVTKEMGLAVPSPVAG